MTSPRRIRPPQGIRVASLRWAAGMFLWIIGALMLVTPDQFAIPNYAALFPHLSWYGGGFLLAGSALIVAAVQVLPRWVVLIAHSAAAAALFLLAFCLGSTGAWTGTSMYAILGGAVLVAPLCSPAGTAASRTSTRDLFTVAAGLAAACTGGILLAFPSQFQSHIYDLLRPHLATAGAYVLLAGAGLVVASSVTSLPRWATVLAHVVGAGAFAIFVVFLALPNRLSTGIVLYGGLACWTLALPWVGHRLHAIDPRSLRVRMSVAFAAAATLPLVAAIAYGTGISKRASTQATLAQQETLAEAVAHDVADYVGLHRQAVAVLAAQPGLLDMPPAQQRALLQAVFAGYPDAVVLAVVDAAGQPVARGDDFKPTPSSGSPVFQDVRRTVRPAVHVLVGPVLHQPVAALGAPILGREGRFAGVVVLSIGTARLADVIAHDVDGAGGRAYLVDETGHAIVNPDPSLATPFVDMSKAAPVAAMRVDADGHGALVYAGSDGRWLAGYARIPDLGWGVVAEERDDVALAGALAASQLTLFAMLIAAAVAIGAGTIVARRLAAPLAELGTAADRLASGDTAQPLPASEITEIAQLSTAFGTMRARLTTQTAEREGALRDLSERATALREKAQLLELATDAIFVLSFDDKRITYWSRGAEELYGWSRGEALGTTSDDLLHTELPRPRAEIEAELVADGRWDGQLVHTTRDGAKVVVASRWALLRDEGGRPLAILEINTDVTERQAVERMKNEFVSVVSHELRTPLTSIRGALGLVASGALGAIPARGQQMLDIAVSNTDRLVRLINDILDIERMESGKVTMTMVACDAADLMVQVRDLLQDTAERAGVTLDVAPFPARLLADPDRIQQTMINLVGNAIKFSPQGGTVRLAAERRAGELVFRVQDQGRGIPADKVDRVFDRFFQVDSSDSREKGGTGLGLAICRTIVEQHGGRIWAESELGKGSSFYFTVPLLDHDAGTEAHADPGLRTLLVCDDDPAVRAVVKAVFERRGYRVVQAASGDEAVQVAVAERPVAILLDILMPGMDGAQTMDALRQRPETAGTPIVIHSVVAPGHADYTLDGAADWLQKPTAATALVAAVERALRKDGSPYRVLVVEDDQSLGSVLSTMLQHRGVQAVRAQSASEAIELASSQPPDLLMLDLALPDGDGYSVVDRLRSEERLRTIPIAVYTARDLDAEERDRLSLGRAEFLTKGHIAPEEAVGRIVGLLDRVTSRADN